MKILSNGWAFPDSDVLMASQISATGDYQRATLDEALRHVRHWRTAVDLGAHVGTWSRVLSTRFDRVIAVEPAPDTYECLLANMQAFGCRNVVCLNAAAGVTPGLVHMALDPANVEKKNTGGRFVQPGGSISIMTVDGLQLDTCDYLKLDVEGSELWALQGASETIKRCRPTISYENKWLWTTHYGLPKLAVAEFLQQRRYREVARVARDLIVVPVTK